MWTEINRSAWDKALHAKYPTVEMREDFMKHTHRYLGWVGETQVGEFKIAHETDDLTSPGRGWIA